MRSSARFPDAALAGQGLVIILTSTSTGVTNISSHHTQQLAHITQHISVKSCGPLLQENFLFQFFDTTQSLSKTQPTEHLEC